MAMCIVIWPAMAAHAATLPGLIAHYPAEGNADDVVGGNDGTLNNGASFTSGQVGQAFDVSGPTDFVSAASPYPFDRGEDFSVAVWTNLDQTPAERAFVIETRRGQASGWALVILADGRYQIGGRCDNNAIMSPTSTTTAPINEWHHTTATFDWASDEINLYVDSCLEAVFDLSTCDGFTKTDKFYLGAISSLSARSHKYNDVS